MVRGYDGTTLRQGDDTPILNGGNLSWCYDTRMERYYTNLDGVDDTMDPSNWEGMMSGCQDDEEMLMMVWLHESGYYVMLEEMLMMLSGYQG